MWRFQPRECLRKEAASRDDARKIARASNRRKKGGGRVEGQPENHCAPLVVLAVTAFGGKHGSGSRIREEVVRRSVRNLSMSNRRPCKLEHPEKRKRTKV